MQAVSLSFHRFDKISARLWVLGQMGAARLALPRLPGLGFWKLCGSGTGEGFTPLPNTAVWAILATWDCEDRAREQTQVGHTFRRWRETADETWTVFLTGTSIRGNWSGQHPFEETSPQSPGPVAALTRATVKPAAALNFWRAEPAISDVIGADPNVAFKIGIGEVPWVQQVTFSIWPSMKSMSDFARRPGGPHAEAIKAVRDGGWFREELYARFRILGDAGSWEGRSPLTQLEIAA